MYYKQRYIKTTPILQICKIGVLFLILFSSCKHQKKANNSTKNSSASYLSLKYAKGFEVNYFNGYKQIIVKYPWKNAKKPINYILVKDSSFIPKNIQTNDIVIVGSIKNIAVISTTYISFIELLHQSQSIAAVSDISYVYSENIHQLYDEKKIQNVGYDVNLNYEKLLACNSKILFTYGIEQAKDETKLQNLGIKRVYVSEYLEENPLAQAEWLLFFAAFYDQEESAKVIFDSIDKRYTTLKNTANSYKEKPIVMCNLPFKGNWYLPGGASIAAQLIRDAGANYVFNENQETGGVNVPFEKAYMMANTADYFIHLNSCINKHEVCNDFPMIKNLKAYKLNHLYNNNLRINDQLANDFWESGIVQPDKILADLIGIFHSTSTKNYSPVYYRKIE